MSYGGNADPSGIQVTFLDQTGAKSVKAVIAFSVPVSRIIPNIITKMSLPATSPDGQPMSYSLDHKEGAGGCSKAGRWSRPGSERRPSDRLPRGRGRSAETEASVEFAPAADRRRSAAIEVAPSVSASTYVRRPSPRTRALSRPCTNLLEFAGSATTWRPSSGCARRAPSSASRPREIRRSNTTSFSRERACGATAGRSRILEHHRVEIKLGASYPRTIPEIRWLTPIYHPNISEIGMVCLGGYGTHWVPSVQLDELCVMLWDMARYHNYDIRSPYNREAALWVAESNDVSVPDRRPPAPRPAGRAGAGRVLGENPDGNGSAPARADRPTSAVAGSTAEVTTPVGRVRQFIERYGRVSTMPPVRTGDSET